MRFAWDDDQLAFAEAARDLLAKECPPAVVRAAADGLDPRPWFALGDMGALHVLAPEDRGGLGLDELSLVPVLVETGRVALPHPIVETAMVAVPLGITEHMVATDLGGPLVPTADDAEALLLAGRGDVRSYWPDEVEVVPVASVDPSRRLGRVQPRGEGNVVTDDRGAIELAFDRGALGTAAQLVGLALAMLDLTVAYVIDRHQFGVPVGSFQAVKHHLANARLAVEFAEPAVMRAAWSVANGEPTRERDVSMAKSLATAAAETTGRAALQCHGAIGYTVEHDLHLYLKRSWALARTWGDRGFHADRVARALSI